MKRKQEQLLQSQLNQICATFPNMNHSLKYQQQFGVAAALAVLSYFMCIYTGAVDKFVQKAVAKLEAEDKEQEMKIVPVNDPEKVEAASPSSTTTGGNIDDEAHETDGLTKFAKDAQAIEIKFQPSCTFVQFHDFTLFHKYFIPS